LDYAAYSSALDMPAKRALYDNLKKSEALALLNQKNGAEEGIRTPTVLLPPAPQVFAKGWPMRTPVGSVDEA
jgi:hypothetical protein